MLEGLGWPPYEAREAAMRFRRRNIELMQELYPHNKDRAKLIAASAAGRQQFQEQIAREREERRQRAGRGWNPGGEAEEPRP